MTTKKDYTVGYGKPPVHSRWKKGQSGNPKGRRPKHLGLGPLMEAFLRQSVVARVGKSTKRMTRLECLVRQLFERALKGDPRILKMVLDEARRNDALVEETQDALEPADHEVVKALCRRLAGSAAE